MPSSKVYKLIGLGAIGVAAILILVFVYSFSRNQLCPEDGELMFRTTSTCYPKDSKGPCTHNLIFLEESPKSRYGECNCPYTKFNRTLLYQHESQRCFFVFSQAYCDEGQWLTVKKEEPHKGSAICEKNECLQHSTNDLENAEEEKHSIDYETVQWVPIKGGGCARLGSHVEGCPENAVVRFHSNYILPSCFEPKKSYPVGIASIGVPASSCSLGSYPSIMGKCQPEFSFDFE